MRVFDEPATAPRMLLLNEVRFDPDWIFQLDRPLFLLPGDQVAMDEGRLVVRRAAGEVEHPSGEREPWCWRQRLV
ncbi:hypothetical protein [Actinacidiphila acididurans]|uniref:Uncharacterized protein n=1 Tax=Actinacidiphila acididurans TaxID=2784346 RepID=A0ABS2U4D5_9ACTN|nr:hypothetical protein [Actinacidiphila acididurans]MBM9510482.1 hypothetical protein [Actinacidiphila acididurans]